MPRMNPIDIPIRAQNQARPATQGAKKDVESLVQSIQRRMKEAKASFTEVNQGLELYAKAINGIRRAWDATGGELIRQLQLHAEFAVVTENLAKQLDITTTEVQELQHVARITGVPVDQLANSMSKTGKAAYDASRGSSAMVEAFERLGVAFEVDGKLRPMSEMFDEITAKLGAMDDEAMRTGIAMQLLGEAGAKITPAFRDGAASVAELRKEARESAWIMDHETIKALRTMADEIDRLSQDVGALARDAVTPFAEDVTALASRARDLVDELRPWATVMSEITQMTIALDKAVLAFAWDNFMPQSVIDRLNTAHTVMKALSLAITVGRQMQAERTGADTDADFDRDMAGFGPTPEELASKDGFSSKQQNELEKLAAFNAQRLDIEKQYESDLWSMEMESEQWRAKTKAGLQNAVFKNRESATRAHLNKLMAFEESFTSATSALAAAGFLDQKKAGKAQALVSMYVGAAKALEMPFPASIAAWAQVLATGKQMVSGVESTSIGGGGIGGGGGGGFTPPPAPEPPAQFAPTPDAGPMTQVHLTINALDPKQAAETLAPEIAEIAKDGRVQLVVREGT